MVNREWHVAVDEGMHYAIVTAAVGQRTGRDSVSVPSSFGIDSARLDLVGPWSPRGEPVLA